MSIVVDRLRTLDDLIECEKLQRTILGPQADSVLRLPALAAVERAGGLLLGAREGSRRELSGALVDLVADADGYPARFTAFLGVAPEAIRRGIGQALRHAERAACKDAGADLVFWWSDPLQSDASHVSFNKLGAISTAHIRNALGPLDDRLNAGLATDRIRVEWWVDAPRVRSILDRGLSPPHYQLGFDQMQVMTHTTVKGTAERALVKIDENPSSRFVLVEIPVDLAHLRAEDAEGARRWRLLTRSAFELLFEAGYTIVGFIHEGGRSFHLFEKEDRGTVLGRL